jgi:hypothetical protein
MLLIKGINITTHIPIVHPCITYSSIICSCLFFHYLFFFVVSSSLSNLIGADPNKMNHNGVSARQEAKPSVIDVYALYDTGGVNGINYMIIVLLITILILYYE